MARRPRNAEPVVTCPTCGHNTAKSQVAYTPACCNTEECIVSAYYDGRRYVLSAKHQTRRNTLCYKDLQVVSYSSFEQFHLDPVYDKEGLTTGLIHARTNVRVHGWTNLVMELNPHACEEGKFRTQNPEYKPEAAWDPRSPVPFGDELQYRIHRVVDYDSFIPGFALYIAKDWGIDWFGVRASDPPRRKDLCGLWHLSNDPVELKRAQEGFQVGRGVGHLMTQAQLAQKYDPVKPPTPWVPVSVRFRGPLRERSGLLVTFSGLVGATFRSKDWADLQTAPLICAKEQLATFECLPILNRPRIRVTQLSAGDAAFDVEGWHDVFDALKQFPGYSGAIQMRVRHSFHSTLQFQPTQGSKAFYEPANGYLLPEELQGHIGMDDLDEFAEEGVSSSEASDPDAERDSDDSAPEEAEDEGDNVNQEGEEMGVDPAMNYRESGGYAEDEEDAMDAEEEADSDDNNPNAQGYHNPLSAVQQDQLKRNFENQSTLRRGPQGRPSKRRKYRV